MAHLRGDGRGPPSWGQPHGYVFEVPLNVEPGELTVPVPLKVMGRFAHEALAVDQDTGIVYLTEDAGSGAGSGFYRFLPHRKSNLRAGGRLQMLGIARHPQAGLREGQRVGKELRVRWFDVLDPDPASPGNASPTRTFAQGFNQGGAKFNRLEGCWYGDGHIFFVSWPRSAGAASPRKGRVWVNGLPVSRDTVRRLRTRVAEVEFAAPLMERRSLLWNALAVAPRGLRTVRGCLRFPRQVARRAAREALDLVRLGAKAATPVSVLTRRDRLHLRVARALAFRPECLLASEVDLRLPPEDAETVLGLLRCAARDWSLVVLASVEDEGLAYQAGDRVVVLDDGLAGRFTPPPQPRGRSA